MTIASYTGLTGSGKSYNVVTQVIIPALKQSRVIAHNLQLNEAALKAVCELQDDPKLIQLAKDTKPDELIKLCPPGAVIVLDECWRYWPAGLTAADLPEDQRSFFAEHRHRTGTDGKSTEIILLVQVTYRHEKLDKVGAKNKFRVDIYSGAATGQKPPKSSLLRQTFGTYKPQVQACYISQTMSETGAHGDEDNPDKRANLLRGALPKIVAAAVVIICLSLWGAKRSVDHLAHREATTTPPATSAAPKRAEPASAAPAGPVTVIVPAPEAPPSKKREGPELSSKWRLIGVAVKQDGTGVAFLTSATAKRRVNAELCKLTKAPADYECLIDGERVTQWTGDAPFASAQLPDGALPGTSTSTPTAPTS